ncbi:G-type lectin S-receptor-like serine/threonine-protein kinase SD2-5 [Magnolia sinica]|uniref:G-type lectin S-receptor-like serine/threonine-protein kinase SD2-5 n=1 Tax=Magnolia sinica TaxID=86752 RepID=UPI002659789B|nr:G-type lectin S-receptor-like serine/threonine-protein kinase SD2-5 [Magnolia sinica]
MPRRFSYEDLRTATKDFKEKLGEGGFGSVFKGILEDGTKIAVKQLENIGQGMKEFLAEVETIGNIHHFNLVRLIGFCAERSHQLLVYEYMSNGSLDSWIFDRNKNQVLDWLTRKKIILDIAKGLAYLHEECRQRIVHLDIKPQNILLDDNFNAKVSDFGLSKLMDRDQSQVQTTMRGTPGYLAPEWKQLRVTLKVDIYSFGIVVLEIVCGRKNLDRYRSEQSKHLLRLLQEKGEENRLIDIIDGSSVDMQLHREEAMKMIRLAAWCLQDDHTRRPLMSVVVKVLEGAMEVETEISYSFCNAMANNPTTRADSPISSNPQQASVLSAPR